MAWRDGAGPLAVDPEIGRQRPLNSYGVPTFERPAVARPFASARAVALLARAAIVAAIGVGCATTRSWTPINGKVGPIDELKTIGKIDLKEIRYLSPRAAMDRWGEGHPGGVIVVTTVQGAGPDTTSE